MTFSNFKNKPQIIVDEFNNSTKIIWLVVGGYLHPYNSSNISPIGGVISNSDEGKDLIFSFESYENKDYLSFYFSKNDFKLGIGDKISFLFEDNYVLPFELNETPKKSRYSWINLYETKSLITQNELQTFAKKKLLKWKIEFISQKKSIMSDAKNFYWYSKDNYQMVVQNLANEYLELVKVHIINHSPLIDRSELTAIEKNINEECFVYLMIDTTNNFHKIGISNNPKYREKTLQSDKPTIELLYAKVFPNRKIAENLEKTLHEVYSHKRLRGEWFELNNDEINEIIITLS